MNEHWLGQLIEGAYDAAVDGNWYEWMEWLRRSMGASGGFLARLTQEGEGSASLPIACGSDLCSDLIRTYVAHRGQDPWYQTAQQCTNNVIALDAKLRRQRARSEIATLYEQLECHFHTGVVLSSDNGHFLLTLHRGPCQNDFSPEQLEALGQITRHLRQALALTPFLFERVEARLNQTQLSDPHCPQAVVRANGIPAFINEAMDDFLASSEQPFSYHQGRLAPRQPLLRRLVEQAQRQACQRHASVKVPLGQRHLSVTPLPEQVLPDAALWQIQ
ncbi:hypothetical protein [Ferrimonas marina]|uniref:Uncharacterized protein n=1 Tax=Ferrimonas marina TaxID=299255 RepID=A0A1M5RKX6_9GAMM|nr:hypothetical protein [Ferrimonas marina]SHH27002.1 hypothetical protein SAMN02745129_1665 [Ferrimonas marina]